MAYSSPATYMELNVAKRLRSADQIVTQWTEDRRSIAHNLTELGLANPWGYFVPQENACSCKVSGKFTIRGMCSGCGIMSNLFKDGNIKVDTPNTITVGIYAGSQFFIVQANNGVFNTLKGYVKSKDPFYEGNKIMRDVVEMQACESNFITDVQETTFFASRGSYEEHYAIISSFIESELSKIGIPCIPTFRWIWNCCNTFNIVEQSTILGRGSLDRITSSSDFVDAPKSPIARSKTYLPLSSQSCRGIVGQLLSTLHYLQFYRFNHGKASMNSLAFSRSAASFVYDGALIVCPFTLFMIPSGLSSISIGGKDGTLRIYHPGIGTTTKYSGYFPSVTSNVYLGTKYSISTCDPRGHNPIPCMPQYTEDTVIGYKIGKEHELVSRYTQHLGLPIFHKSLDLYSFLISLVFNPSFREGMIRDQPLLDLWKTMWDPKEYPKIMGRIEELNSQDVTLLDSTEVVRFLSDYTLRCDAIDHMWAGFKLISHSAPSSSREDTFIPTETVPLPIASPTTSISLSPFKPQTQIPIPTLTPVPKSPVSQPVSLSESALPASQHPDGVDLPPIVPPSSLPNIDEK